MKTVAIIGRPLSGKTTQGNILEKKYGLVRIDVAETVIQYVKSPLLEIAKTAKRYVDAGQPVPVNIVTLLLKDRILQKDCLQRGWILDGVSILWMSNK